MKCKVEKLSRYFNDSDQKASLTQTKQSTTIAATKYYLTLIKHFRKFSVNWFVLPLCTYINLPTMPRFLKFFC